MEKGTKEAWEKKETDCLMVIEMLKRRSKLKRHPLYRIRKVPGKGKRFSLYKREGNTLSNEYYRATKKTTPTRAKAMTLWRKELDRSKKLLQQAVMRSKKTSAPKIFKEDRPKKRRKVSFDPYWKEEASIGKHKFAVFYGKGTGQEGASATTKAKANEIGKRMYGSGKFTVKVFVSRKIRISKKYKRVKPKDRTKKPAYRLSKRMKRTIAFSRLPLKEQELHNKIASVQGSLNKLTKEDKELGKEIKKCRTKLRKIKQRLVKLSRKRKPIV